MNTNLKILLIEDDALGVFMFKRVVDALKQTCEFIHATDGEAALQILRDKQFFPDLIFSDLNMPGINGIDFLTILKMDSVLKYIPVVILTTSSNQKDVRICYEKGIAGYVLKPLKYEDYTIKIDRVLNYWKMNELL